MLMRLQRVRRWGPGPSACVPVLMLRLRLLRLEELLLDQHLLELLLLARLLRVGRRRCAAASRRLAPAEDPGHAAQRLGPLACCHGDGSLTRAVLVPASKLRPHRFCLCLRQNRVASLPVSVPCG